jgi:hypothetical protein
VTTSHSDYRREDDREKPFDPFEEEGDSPFAEDSARRNAQDFDGNPDFDEDLAEFEEETQLDSAGDQFERPAQLDLGDDNQRLPWLEGDPDEDEDRGAGAGQMFLLGLAAVALLAIVVGGIWWATRAGPDEELVADGGTITAPDGPYKERPEDPGGRVARGTGDTAFAVAEGQTRPMRVGEGETAPAPGFDSVPSSAASPAATQSAAPATPAASEPPKGPGVQIGAYSNRESAEQGWQKLSAQYEGLSGMRYRIVEGQADIGKVYRLQALPGDSAAAQNLCRGLKAARISCQVKN